MLKPKPNGGRRLFLLKQLREWHWISSAISLAGLLFFAATGITLNHAADIPAEPRTVTRQATLPTDLVKALAATPADPKAPLPAPVATFIKQDLKVPVAGKAAEWSEDEIYVGLPRAGGDATLIIDRVAGSVDYESTSRGAVAYLNDLHKGRNTGVVWKWFIDIFAVACLVFAGTGLWLLYLLSASRKLTWPMVAGGLALPVILALFFLHL